MAKEKTVSGLERKFSRIETWDEFLKRWEDAKTEEEAIGLLYAGANTKIDFTKESLKECLKFYLDWAGCSNETIATIAQQVIIKSWLRQVPVRHWVGYDKDSLEIVGLLLKFLQSPTETIRKPPYPRFASEWLLSIHEGWRHGTHPDYQRSATHIALQELTKPIVKALCAWGLGYILASDGLRPEIIPMIKEFLDDHNYEPGKVFFELSGHGEPSSDLSNQEKVNYTAACAFLKLKFWVGGGFTANFIRTFPPKYLAE